MQMRRGSGLGREPREQVARTGAQARGRSHTLPLFKAPPLCGRLSAVGAAQAALDGVVQQGAAQRRRLRCGEGRGTRVKACELGK